MDDGLRSVLARQRYAVLGDEAAVKTCHWLRESLLRGRVCYKEAFYGIRSHRCLQMTPTVTQCTQNCLFCWRYQGFKATEPRWLDPEDLLEQAVAAQRELITGFKGDSRCSLEMWKEAAEPNMVAISLAGEPVMYPHLGEFIRLCHRRGMTTFLVTNGTLPERLEALTTLPTQLYVTVAAPDEATYRKLCIPNQRDGWQRLRRTLELLPSLDTRRVVRHTLVKNWNLRDAEAYARLDELADPHFVEPKGYVFVGYSRQRLTMENMPSMDEIRAFGGIIADKLGMSTVGEQAASRVMVMSDGRIPTRIGERA